MSRTKKRICIVLIFVLCCSFPLSRCFAYSKDEDKWTGEDKALHLTVSFALDTLSYNYYRKNTDFTDSQSKIAAFLTTLTIGVTKEFIDERFSWKDIGANVIGTSIGAALSIEF